MVYREVANMFTKYLESFSDFFYPHEKKALIEWDEKLAKTTKAEEAQIYFEASSVLLETLKLRLERFKNDKIY
ncbi:MAG: hypothetical protein JWN30_1994 [Bacilli bacterium]|nr:hypothetical protein [Bacilli bacterium]